MIRPLVLILLSLLVLVGLFLVLRPEGPTGQPQARAFDLRIRDGSMNPGEITISEGDRVTLRVTANQPTEFHIHGYDLERELEPDETAEISFEAAITGRFEIETHPAHAGGDDHSHAEDDHSHGASGTLIVEPR